MGAYKLNRAGKLTTIIEDDEITNFSKQLIFGSIIISFLWAYSAFMLFSLKIEGESILNKDLVYDILLSLLVSIIIYVLLINLDLNFENTIFNLIINSIIVIISFLVSTSIIRMNYVEFKRRK